MYNLLRKGFQPVTETEMVMVEGGGLNYLDFWYWDTEAIENEDGTITKECRNAQPVERSEYPEEIKIVSGIMQAKKMSGCGSGCYASCCVNSLNDYF